MNNMIARISNSARLIVIVMVFFVLAAHLYAQSNLSEVSIKVGLIRNYQESMGEPNNNSYSFLPEIELGGDFFLKNTKWGVSLGYWDNQAEPNIWRDYFPNSYQAIIVTPRFYYTFSSIFHVSQRLAVSIFAGLSYQAINTSPFYPHDIYGNKVEDKTDIIVEPIFGTQFGYMLYNHLIFSGEIGYHLISRNVNNIHQIEMKFLIKYLMGKTNEGATE